jgi:hypothetical protein
VIPGSNSHVERHRAAFAAVFREQRDSGLFVPEEWDDIFADVYRRQAERTVEAFGDEVAKRFGTAIDMAFVQNYLTEYARISAESTNATTAESLAAAEDDEQTAHVWEVAIGSRALQIAVSKVTSEANFGRNEAASQAGVRMKRWVVTSRNPRATHARMNGQTAEIGEPFSNGAMWPGDVSLSLDERAGCSCLVEF